ncbi:MAG TPA: discoidin domain-containing protein [Polyangia bacterium]|nr:discoidin domain-containing protein [Polyangia bacterium]
MPGADAGVSPSMTDLGTPAGLDALSGSAADAPSETAPTAQADAAGGDAPTATRTYEAEAGALFGNATKVACASCSNGRRVSIGADSGVTFSNVSAPESGTNTLLIYYTNADSENRSIYVGINGGDSQQLLSVFPPTGGAGNVSSIAVPLSGFNAGSNNTIMFFIDSELRAPDLDDIGFAPSSVANGSENHCDRSTWKATASVTGGDGAGPPGGIDGNLATRWANNHAQNGTDWYQVDFGGLVSLARITLDNTRTFPNDYAGAYAVFASLDGVRFDTEPFVKGTGTPYVTVIDFAKRTVRAVKVTQVGSSRSPLWWQIGELTVICAP